MTSPLGIRNNNPGNIRFGGGWQGETRGDGGFARFPTMVMGIRAFGKQLLAYQARHGIDTVRGAVSRWAPANENHTEGYIAYVCHVCELNQDDRLDFSDPNTLYWMIVAMGEMENGYKAFHANVTDEMIEEGMAAALA